MHVSGLLTRVVQQFSTNSTSLKIWALEPTALGYSKFCRACDVRSYHRGPNFNIPSFSLGPLSFSTPHFYGNFLWWRWKIDKRSFEMITYSRLNGIWVESPHLNSRFLLLDFEICNIATDCSLHRKKWCNRTLKQFMDLNHSFNSKQYQVNRRSEIIVAIWCKRKSIFRLALLICAPNERTY